MRSADRARIFQRGRLIMRRRHAMLAPSLDRIFHQKRDRHWTNSTGDRGYFAAQWRYRGEVHIPGESVAGFFGGIGYPIDADVDDHGPRFDHVGRDKFRFADGGNEHIC